MLANNETGTLQPIAEIDVATAADWFGIDVDTGAIPDYDVFYECLVAGFDEVLALASAPA